MADKLVFVELPMLVIAKSEGGKAEEFTRKGALCFEPPVEVVPHPQNENASLLSTSFGTKQVDMPYEKLMEMLRG
jgi:hypothetical protein